jgi:hypothetical protein
VVTDEDVRRLAPAPPQTIEKPSSSVAELEELLTDAGRVRAPKKRRESFAAR